jgi:cellulose synthase/poly-beta-1,6-N-acetylglucosamine synthase-like glycosyltransferase
VSDTGDQLSRSEYLVAATILLGAVLVLVYLLPYEILLLGAVVVLVASGAYTAVYLLIRAETRVLDGLPVSPVWLLFALPVVFSVVFVEVFDVYFPLVNGVLFVALLLSTFTYWLIVPGALYQHISERERRITVEEWPSVAVLVPAYNEEGYVGPCIDSFLDAEYPEEKLEMVVVDDGSTDRTFQEAVSHANEDVRVLQKPNGGKHSALNRGLEETDSELVVCVDADSKVEPGALKELVRTYRSDPETAAVAGNVRVENADSLVTRLQSLEYIIGINMFRRALDVLGFVKVVPGCLGMFERETVERVGGYSEDTVTEDFDLTLSLLKLGKQVRHSSKAVVETEVPETWRDLYSQRLRWFRGNAQTVFKHSNVFTDTGFGRLHLVMAPYFLLSMLVIPGLGFVVFGLILWMVLTGSLVQFLGLLALFTLLQALFCALAVLIEEDDLSLVVYAPLTIIGYKQFLDTLLAKGIFDVLTRDDLGWTHARRVRQRDRAGSDD